MVIFGKTLKFWQKVSLNGETCQLIFYFSVFFSKYILWRYIGNSSFQIIYLNIEFLEILDYQTLMCYLNNLRLFVSESTPFYNLLVLGKIYGTHPWHWYFSSALPSLLGPLLLLLVPGLRHAPLHLLLPLGVNLLFLSLLPHKVYFIS